MKADLNRLVEIMSILRSEKGCPWDKEQDLHSLRSFLLEEVYEVIEAINKDDSDKLKEELGDLLFQIIFVAQIGREKGLFSLEEIINFCYQKMLRRHPHVFGEKKVDNSIEVLKQWEMIKGKEKSEKINGLLLEDVDPLLPALLKTHLITTKASRIGFDWSVVDQIIDKLKEELSELQQAIKLRNREEMEHEIGDLLFAAANISRFLGVNPEIALQKINKNFITRFNYIETKLKERGKTLEDSNLDEMDALWEEAKKYEKGRGGKRAQNDD